MPNILFASNSVSHFPGTEARNAAWSYDSNRVPYSIYTPPLTAASTPMFKATTTDETWFHFRCGSENWSVNNEESICEIVDANGERIVNLFFHNRTNQGFHLNFVAGSQSDTVTKWLPMLEHQARTYDIRILYSDVIARVELYMNEMLVLTQEFTVSSRRVPRFLRIGGMYGNGNAFGGYFSEIIVADADTRNARLDLLRPVAVGAYANWNGLLSALGDDDPTTGMTTIQENQNQSTILSNYGGATNISNVVQVTTSVRGINSPSKLEHLIRLSGVDYLTDDFDIPYAKDYQVTDWKLNPATSLPWEAEDLEDAEFGFKSIL